MEAAGSEMHAGSSPKVACGHGQSPTRPSLDFASSLNRAGGRQGLTNTEGRQEKATGMKCEAGRERERLGCWLDSEEVWVSDWMRASGARLRAGLCAQVGIRLQAAMTGLRGQEDKVRD